MSGAGAALAGKRTAARVSRDAMNAAYTKAIAAPPVVGAVVAHKNHPVEGHNMEEALHNVRLEALEADMRAEEAAEKLKAVRNNSRRPDVNRTMVRETRARLAKTLLDEQTAARKARAGHAQASVDDLEAMTAKRVARTASREARSAARAARSAEWDARSAAQVQDDTDDPDEFRLGLGGYKNVKRLSRKNKSRKNKSRRKKGSDRR